MILLRTFSLVYFQYLCLLELHAVFVFAYFKWIKGKKLFEKRFENKHFNDISKIHGDY